MDIDPQLHDAIAERIALGKTATEITAQLTEAGYDTAEATQLYETVRDAQDTDEAASHTPADTTETASPSGTQTALIVAGIVLVVVTGIFVVAYFTLDLGALLRSFR